MKSESRDTSDYRIWINNSVIVSNIKLSLSHKIWEVGHWQPSAYAWCLLARTRARAHTHTHTHTSCDTHFQLLSIEKTLPYLFHENTNNAHTHVLCWYITKDSTCPTAVLLMQSRATLAFWRHKDGGRERMPKDGAWQRVRAWSHSLETWDEQKYRMRKFWKFCEEGGMSKQGTPKKRQMRHLLMTWRTS